MRRRGVVWGGIVLLSTVLALPQAASAQLPVCPQPEPAAPYYAACVSSGRILVARLLFDLAIDHVLKPDSDPVRRRAGDLFRSVVTDEALERNTALRGYLERLEPLRLTKLDTSTGLLQLTVADEARRFEGAIDVGTTPFHMTLQLPERLGGGYWRTPDVLQIAFWEGQRATVGFALPGGGALESEIDCLVVSTDGVRVVTRGTQTPDILVRFDQCDE